MTMPPLLCKRGRGACQMHPEAVAANHWRSIVKSLLRSVTPLPVAVAAVSFALLLGVLTLSTSNEATADEVVVHMSPTCGCCSLWVDHLRENGFTVTTREIRDVRPVKERLGLPHGLGSCHTAEVGGYVVEGHVPAADIRRMLAERPPIAGIAVPGMPMGSPGMEGAYNDPYDVVSFDHQGNTAVYASYPE
jgi:hypothetical protein